MVATSGTFEGCSWHTAACLVALDANVNAYAPHRSHASDGTIGDATHVAQGHPTYDARTGKASGGTDHMPDDRGVVCALDVGHDPAGGCDASALADHLAAAIVAGVERRVDYLVDHVRGRIFHEWPRWHWDPYDNNGQAANHLHVSTLHLAAVDDDTHAWPITSAPTAPTPTLAPSPTRKANRMECFYTVPDHPTDTMTAWFTNGLATVPLTAQQLSVYQFVAATNGAPTATLGVGHFPYAVHRRIPGAR